MNPIEIRNLHTSTLVEVENILHCCRQMMIVATGGAPDALLNDTHDILLECGHKITGIATRLGTVKR